MRVEAEKEAPKVAAKVPTRPILLYHRNSLEEADADALEAARFAESLHMVINAVKAWVPDSIYDHLGPIEPMPEEHKARIVEALHALDSGWRFRKEKS